MYQPTSGSSFAAAGERRAHPFVNRNARLLDVIEAFRSSPSLRMLPVTDDAIRPVGAIFETEVRDLLFNPYGHALMQNPGFGASIETLVRPCPMAEASRPLGELLDIYAAAGRSEGLILTRNGRYDHVLENGELVALAGERELEIARERAGRAERIAEASRSFTDDVETLSQALAAVAAETQSLAHQLAGRAETTQEGATATAMAASQAVDALEQIAGLERQQANAFDRITADTQNASRLRAEAHRTVGAAGDGVRSLANAARAIDKMLVLIQEMADKTNLLALNASIEAVRAGDSGRGFGVVAAEVKALALQTSGAAAEIGDHVAEIHAVVAQVVNGHCEVERAIGEIAEISASTDRAVDAQSAATRIIASHVEDSVEAADEILARARSMSESATSMNEEAGALGRLSTALGSSGTRLHLRSQEFVQAIAQC